MSINFFSEDVVIPKLKKRILTRWVNSVITSEGKIVGDISFIFCSDDFLLEINKKFLNHDYYTDIITFDYVQDNIIQGDIFVSIDRVKENAIFLDESLENELHRILIHGVLHLLGYLDKTIENKRIMTSREDECLNLLITNFL